MSSIPRSLSRGLSHPVTWSVAFLAAYIAARAVAEVPSLPLALRLPVVLSPVLFLVLALITWSRGLREAVDELERRVQLEALALAFACTFVLLLTLGLLELVVTLPAQDLSYRHVWALLPTLYFLGLVLARRRYA